MSVDALILRYGVLAVFVGAGIEGEIVVITGGVLAHRGLVPLVPACVAAALGSCLADQLWFHAARRFRDRWPIRAIRWRPAFRHAVAGLERRQAPFLLGFRFVYGLRTVGPIAIAASGVPTRRYVLLDSIAAAVWGPAFTLLGYALGEAARPMLGWLTGHAALIAALAIAAAAVFALVAYRLAVRTRSGRSPVSDTGP